MNRSPRTACNFQLSGLLFSLLITAMASTVALAAVLVLVALGRISASWSLGTTLIATAASWVAFIAVLCRDQTLAAIIDLHERIEEYGDERESEGRIDALRDVAGQPPQPRDGRLPSRLHAAN